MFIRFTEPTKVGIIEHAIDEVVELPASLALQYLGDKRAVPAKPEPEYAVAPQAQSVEPEFAVTPQAQTDTPTPAPAVPRAAAKKAAAKSTRSRS